MCSTRSSHLVTRDALLHPMTEGRRGSAENLRVNLISTIGLSAIWNFQQYDGVLRSCHWPFPYRPAIVISRQDLWQPVSFIIADISLGPLSATMYSAPPGLCHQFTKPTMPTHQSLAPRLSRLYRHPVPRITCGHAIAVYLLPKWHGVIGVVFRVKLSAPSGHIITYLIRSLLLLPG